MTGELVLVTGATGFISQWTVKYLLERGYRVRGTVRDVKKTEKYAFLRNVAVEFGSQDETKFSFVSAELTKQEGWAEAVNGVDYVLHIASPYVLDVKDPQKDLVDPAVNGTMFVLNACLGQKQLKAVGITSSVAAISDCFEEWKTHTYNADDWNTTSTLSRNPYYYSKTLAERAAHRFMEENKPSFRLFIINPFAVMGPALDANAEPNTSIGTVIALMHGEVPIALPLITQVVDVRDIALGHILAMEAKEGPKNKYNRYLLVSGPLDNVEMGAVIAKTAPKYASRVPTKKPFLPLGVYKFSAWISQPKDVGSYLWHNMGKSPKFDTADALALPDFKFRTPEETVRDTVNWLIENKKLKHAIA